MRFTRKLIGGSFDVPTAQFYASQKLGKLEDVEDELGIDLLVLFKAIKNGIFAKVLKHSNINYSRMGCINYEKKTFFTHTYGSSKLRFKDYGKTWALTKEELEECK